VSGEKGALRPRADEDGRRTLDRRGYPDNRSGERFDDAEHSPGGLVCGRAALALALGAALGAFAKPPEDPVRHREQIAAFTNAE
jgi:hypothetical protein